MTFDNNRSRSQNWILIVSLGFLNALTPFTIDMYLPSFPEIARDLQTPVAQMGLTVAIYFVGFSIGQLLYGPLLDRFGRKQPLYIGLALYILATLGCIFARSFEQLLCFRFLSAFGACAVSVGPVAMTRDFFPPQAAAKIFSLLMLVLSVSPLLAPSVGSFLITTTGWRAIFAILALVAVVDLAIVRWILPDGAAPDPTVRLSPGPILVIFKEVLRHRQFTIYALAGALAFAGLFVYVATSPTLFMEGFHLNAQQYGGVFALLAVGMIGGGQLNLLLTQRWREKQIFFWSLLGEVVLSLIFLLFSLTESAGLTTTVVLMFLILTCTGISFPNAAALALATISEHIGSASSLLGFLQLSLGALVSALAGFLPNHGPLSTAIAIASSSTIALLLLIFAPKQSQSLG